MYETCFSPLDRLCADASTAARELGGSTVETFVREHDGRTIPCIRFGLLRDIELLLIASDGYPGTPPVLLVTGPDGTTTQVNLEWNVALAAEQRLLTALREHFRGVRSEGRHHRRLCRIREHLSQSGAKGDITGVSAGSGGTPAS